MKTENYLKSVRNQYENLPYPPRDIEQEKVKLVMTHDALEEINHYCYQGKQDFNNNFRVLVAGGGTGDAVVYMGEQIIGKKGAEIVYLDISTASLEVAKKRAKIRGLDKYNHIRYIHGSLLDVADMGLGKFDYINCTGVLHHLDNPTAGLNALNSVLKDDGVMCLMVYATYGRTAVYHMQSTMRIINEGVDDIQQQIENCKTMLKTLPKENWFQRTYDLFTDHTQYGDSGVYDLLLHSQDRSYTVPELYEWVEASGLDIRCLLGSSGLGRMLYNPLSYIKDAAMREKVAKMDEKKQQALAELLIGVIRKHVFFATKKPVPLPSLDDMDNVPFYSIFFYEKGIYETVYTSILRRQDDSFSLKKHNVYLSFKRNNFIIAFFKFFDGKRTIGELVKLIKAELDKKESANHAPEEIHRRFKIVYNSLAYHDWVFLRHKSVGSFPSANNMQHKMAKRTGLILA